MKPPKRLPHPSIVPLLGEVRACRFQYPPAPGKAFGPICCVNATHVVAWDQTNPDGSRQRQQSARCTPHAQLFAAAQRCAMPTLQQMLNEEIPRR